MICTIYVVTGLYGLSLNMTGNLRTDGLFLGPTFWDQPMLTFLGLDNVPQITKYIPNCGLNEAFMYFGALGLAFSTLR